MFTFNIPQSQTGYGLLEFATYVLDHSPLYETRAQMRSGYKALDSIESAIKSGSVSVSMPDDIGRSFKEAVESTPIPKLFIIVNGQAQEPVPKTFFTKFYESVESGKKVDDI